MNVFKSILAGSLALSLIGTANAATTIRITGSTAYRGVTHTAIGKILAAGYTVGYAGSTLSGAGQAIFTGTTSTGSISVIIKTSWSGSVGGVQTVAGSLPISNWLVDTTPAGGSAPAVYDAATAPDVAMSDTYQNSTVYTKPALTDLVVGVVPFRFVAGKGAPAALNNITPQLAQALWSNGSAPLGLFTGNNADEGVTVYALGRDPDSGTRLTAFAETGIGVNSYIQQYQPAISAGSVTGYSLVVTSTINGVVVPTGQGGYSSGGNLATALQGLTNATVGYNISYASTGDAATAITGGAKELSYNGVTLEAAAPYTSVIEGKYTFWGYEHLMYKTTLDATKKTVANTLATQILNVDATVKVGDMQVSRPTDGGLVTANYF